MHGLPQLRGASFESWYKNCAVRVAVAQKMDVGGVGSSECRWWQDPTYDRAVHALLVIASLQRNQRLTTEAGESISAAPPHFGQCVMRWIYSEGREANLASVRRVLTHVECALDHAAADADAPPSARRLVARILSALRGALIGIVNLSETYRDDAGTCATLLQLENAMRELLETHGG